MKKTFILLFILYFLIFVIGGLFLYTRYIRNSFSAGLEPLEIETVSPDSAIYWTKSVELSRLNPAKSTKALESSLAEKFQLPGEIGQLEIDKKNSLAVYSLKNTSGNWEIWKAPLKNFSGEKLAYQSPSEFQGYEDFTNPKFNTGYSKLAFQGNGASSDAIFVKDFENNTLLMLGAGLSTKISDYSWNNDSTKIVFCTSSLLKNACYKVDLSSEAEEKVFEGDVKKISWNKTEKIIYLTKQDTPHLFSAAESGSEQKQIDDVASPKVIVTFTVDPYGQKIAYEIISDQKSDIYFSNLDGTGRMQLTTDGNAKSPLFSPSGLEIAFLRPKEGIFTAKTDKSREIKIINLTDSIDAMLCWR